MNPEVRKKGKKREVREEVKEEVKEEESEEEESSLWNVVGRNSKNATNRFSTLS